jgi:hypothetical protein
MDAATTLFAHLLLSGISVVAAVVAVWFAQVSRKLSASDTVDELTRNVAKVLTAQRTEQMRRVRAGASNVVLPGQVGPEGPPELRAVESEPVNRKAELRRRMTQR